MWEAPPAVDSLIVHSSTLLQYPGSSHEYHHTWVATHYFSIAPHQTLGAAAQHREAEKRILNLQHLRFCTLKSKKDIEATISG